MSTATLPKGIVTFCFTDIEGSTRLLRQLGDQYAEVAERHADLMHQAWDSYDGKVVNTAGDSVLVAFEDPGAAIQASASAQRLLTAETWPAGGEVRVRMGIHSGLAFPRGGTYLALAVNQAARVMSAAHGGQVLVSAETVNRTPVVNEVDMKPVGRYRIRDFDDEVLLYQLAGHGLASEFPAVRALPADGHNLVEPATTLIGRKDVVSKVAGLIRTQRVVTLVGPGGVGKTRLANEVGRLLAPRWRDGVWMVDVAPIGDPSRLPAAIGEATGAPVGDGDRWPEVLNHLNPRNVLLLLDNCEHLREATALLTEQLLASCPSCGVVVTSREPLGLARETVTRVSPLELEPAIELFTERASAVGATVDHDATEVADICRHLDGLPLALELAAAHMNVLTPTELLAGLSDRFRILRARDATQAARQRTMEGALEWSDRLLDDDERRCLRRLGVFRTSFSIHAATAAAHGEDLNEDDVPPLVWSLVEKSLVVADPTLTETRYRLLESVRAFAMRRLDTEKETPEVAARLLDWYLGRLGPRVRHMANWTSEIAVELDNLLALIMPLGPVSGERAQEASVTIARYFDSVQSYREGMDELRQHLELLPEVTPTRASMLTTLADLHLRCGEVEQAERALAEAEAVRDEAGRLPDWDDVAIERTRGELALRRGDNTLAIEIATAALAEPISLRSQARMASQLGIASMTLGDLDTAAKAFARETDLYRELGDRLFEASSLGNVAEVALRRGDIREAASRQRASLELALQLGMPVMVAFSLITAARVAGERNHWEVAVKLDSRAEVVLESTGYVLYPSDQDAINLMRSLARERLGAEAFVKASDLGQTLDLPEAAALADEVLASA